MYNAYIPQEAPYEPIPEKPPVSPSASKGGNSLLTSLLGGSGSSFSGLTQRLGLDRLDSGDLILFLLLFLMLREEGKSDGLLLLLLAAAFLMEEEGKEGVSS